jgi:myo-inositol-1(or 4)-monophosphatase
MSDYLATCEKAARAGGRVLLDWQGRFQAKAKGPKDFVTEADLASQRAIEAVVLGEFPDHAFLGEESTRGDCDSFAARQDDYLWIVDPLDGTTNYVHKLQTYAVSVALAHRGELVAGCVYDPVIDECYLAVRGEGAYLNGQRLATSRCETLEEALVAASFPPVMERGSLEIPRFVEVLHRAQSVRRLGSAALNLAYLAAGRLDAYWATSVKAWDIAAGVLLVREAGGAVSDIAGGELRLFEPLLCASATGALHRELLAALVAAEARA